MKTSEIIIKDLQKYGSEEQAAHLSQFFKTGKGQYGEGDIFIGLKVPVSGEITKKYWEVASLEDIDTLLSSPYHEVRLVALLMLLTQYNNNKKIAKKKDSAKALIATCKMKECIDFYLSHTKNINNWDLVDLTCYKLLGDYLGGSNMLSGKLLPPDKSVLYQLVKSKNMWERRISIVTCISFIRSGECSDAIAISELLLNDKEDLMHKAVGWILREVGKANQDLLDQFLSEHSTEMPRTMLRYAIEKYPEAQRQKWLTESKK
jgi:3-methyladenine DNA glycosylase AlkD